MIFLTAHAHHAVEAFELDAADYLLKPVRLERLRQALDRARRQRASRTPASGEEQEFWAPGRKGMVRVPVGAVRWIEAAKDHVFLHTEAQTHMLRTTMAALENKLEGSGLERVHRSIFVRLGAVKEIRRSRKALNLMLDDGVLVPVGPNYVAAVSARLAAELGAPGEGRGRKRHL
jgi:DNA-binding LytR/AlgR family response regulator